MPIILKVSIIIKVLLVIRLLPLLDCLQKSYDKLYLIVYYNRLCLLLHKDITNFNLYHTNLSGNGSMLKSLQPQLSQFNSIIALELNYKVIIQLY